MDNFTCAQVLTLGAGFHFIAGEVTFPICIALMIVAVVADAWKRTPR